VSVWSPKRSKGSGRSLAESVEILSTSENVIVFHLFDIESMSNPVVRKYACSKSQHRHCFSTQFFMIGWCLQSRQLHCCNMFFESPGSAIVMLVHPPDGDLFGTRYYPFGQMFYLIFFSVRSIVFAKSFIAKGFFTKPSTLRFGKTSFDSERSISNAVIKHTFGLLSR
jgi:hypothetical protein